MSMRHANVSGMLSIKEHRRPAETETLLEILPPLDWDKVGTETWGDVVRQIRKVGTGKFIKGIFSRDKEEKAEVWDSVFKTSTPA